MKALLPLSLLLLASCVSPALSPPQESKLQVETLALEKGSQLTAKIYPFHALEAARKRQLFLERCETELQTPAESDAARNCQKEWPQHQTLPEPQSFQIDVHNSKTFQMPLSQTEAAKGYRIELEGTPKNTCLRMRQTYTGQASKLTLTDIAEWQHVNAYDPTGVEGSSCLYGQIKDTQGRPLAHANILIQDDIFYHALQSDSQGYFSRAELGYVESTPLKVQFSKAGYQSQSIELSIQRNDAFTPELNRHDIVLEALHPTPFAQEINLNLSGLSPHLNPEQRASVKVETFENQQKILLLERDLTREEIQEGVILSPILAHAALFEVTVSGTYRGGCNPAYVSVSALAQQKSYTFDLSDTPWITGIKPCE